MTDTEPIPDESAYGVPVSDFEPVSEAAELWKNRRVAVDVLVDPTQLLAHENNPKIHPIAQQRSMKAGYETLGQLSGVIVNQRTGKLIDGHMRVALAISEGAMILVDYVDLSEEEEAVALASYDPLGNGAVIDQESFAALIGTLPALDTALMAAINDAAGIRVPDHPPDPDETDPGPSAPADPAVDDAEPTTDMFLFGFIRWSTIRVDCDGEDVQALTRLYNEYLADNDGKDKGFLGWLIKPQLDSTPTG